MENIIALIMFLLSSYVLIRIFNFSGITENIIFFFLILAAHITLIGYILSAFSILGSIQKWAVAGSILLFVYLLIFFIFIKNRPLFSISLIKLVPLRNRMVAFEKWYKNEISLFEKIILIPMLICVLFLGLVNLTIVLFAAPHNWDSMTYHLAGMAYYLQHNNINVFEANYWAQVVQPKNSSLLFLFSFLASNRNENLTQIVQYLSYWASVISVYAISMRIGKNRTQSLFSAAASALLINWLMESTTTQNDLIVTASIGVIVAALFAYKESLFKKYLIIMAIGAGFSIGVKASALIPLVSVVFIVFLILITKIKHVRNWWQDLIILFVGGLLSISLFALPAGYYENYRYFRNPIGPQSVTKEHTFAQESVKYIFTNGTKNFLRYEIEFLSLDGLPPTTFIKNVQNTLIYFPKKIIPRLGIDLENKNGTREPFHYDAIPSSQEDSSYFGIIGFGLIGIALILSLLGVIKSKDYQILAVASLLFILIQSFSGEYDPWRGRYFTTLAIFTTPITGSIFQFKNRIFRFYLILIVFASCASAFLSIASREFRPFIKLDIQNKTISFPIFSESRMMQLTSNQKEYYETLSNFDRLVPKNASVAVFLKEDSYEYPLFGEHLTRTILPINSFFNHLQPIPSNAQYLLYNEDYPCPSNNDIDLGNNWYLRTLNKTNRECK